MDSIPHLKLTQSWHTHIECHIQVQVDVQRLLSTQGAHEQVLLQRSARHSVLDTASASVPSVNNSHIRYVHPVQFFFSDATVF